MKEHWPDNLVQHSAEEREDGTLKIRFKHVGRRYTELGGLSDPPAGVHLYRTGDATTLCGLNRSEVPSVNAALRDGKDVCAACAR